MRSNFTTTGAAAVLALLTTGITAVHAQSDTPRDEIPGEKSSTVASANEELESTPAVPIDGQITLQGENTVLARDLLGRPVYTSDGEAIGSIANMIINLDGTVEGIVIGVGGFLGIGEKIVALEMSSLSAETDEVDNVRLVTTATEQDLRAADPFVTVAQQEQVQDAMEQADTQGGTMSNGSATDNAGVDADDNAENGEETDAETQ